MPPGHTDAGADEQLGQLLYNPGSYNSLVPSRLVVHNQSFWHESYMSYPSSSRAKFPSLLSVMALALVLTGQACAQMADLGKVPDELAAGYESITAAQASEWLHVLAGPGFGGRGTGQPGYTKAAHWVAGKVAEFGLDPMGDGGTYFQMLPMTQITVDAAESKLSGPDGLEITLPGNISLDRFADQAEVSGQLVFLKLAGNPPQLDEAVELRDKVVIYSCDNDARRFAPRLLGRKGPAAVFRVGDEAVAAGSSQTLRNEGRSRSTSVSGTISRAAADQLLAAAKGEASWLDLAQAADPVHATETSVTLTLRIREESAAVPNVIAWLPGSDPALQNEYMVIGAHLDHLGNRGGSLYPGADDNGSGSTAILSIARALSLNPVKPKRSVLFIWFAAEEIGLVGSRHYTDNPTLPLDQMICMLNIDMVGRNEEQEGETAGENLNTLHLVGSERGDKALHQLILRANESVGFTFEFDEEDVFGRSDQANFFRKGISAAFLFGGFHPDYHQPGDGPEKINYDKIASAARLFYLTAFLAAEHGSFRFEVEEPESEGN